ncbi:MAG: hypothetical protein KDA85_09485, partial [Planctomycetaceae bacterium]|nr:hypothetical protein [Planctomycetaceae bacterium]
MKPGESYSTSLLTDLYQLTMAYGYWKQGKSEQRAVFHLFYRRNPFQGGYAIAAGLEPALRLIESLRFSEDDLDYLQSLTGRDGRPLFDQGFLNYLRQLRPTVDVAA